jgi:23S rRNA pseudoU1915 N3-methylase RlmH
VETTWHEDNDALVKGVETDQSKGHMVVLLDLLGKTRTSEHSSDDLHQWLDQGGSRLQLVIGGAEELPNELKELICTGVSVVTGKSSLISMKSHLLLPGL